MQISTSLLEEKHFASKGGGYMMLAKVFVNVYYWNRDTNSGSMGIFSETLALGALEVTTVRAVTLTDIRVLHMKPIRDIVFELNRAKLAISI